MKNVPADDLEDWGSIPCSGVSAIELLEALWRLRAAQERRPKPLKGEIAGAEALADHLIAKATGNLVDRESSLYSAQAIDARSGKTGTGLIAEGDESAVA